MSKVKFGEYLTVDKKVYKVCPNCRTDIKPEWEHAYKNEWCPACGLNLDEVKKDEKKDIKTYNEILFYEHGMNPLNYNSLSNCVNTHESFKLKHIVEWCCKNTNHQLAEKLLSYISDNNLSDMESEYVINHIPFNTFIEKGKAEEYQEYLGYDMYKVKTEERPRVIIQNILDNVIA